MAMSKCCFRGFQWEGTPMGRVGRLANNDTYIAGNNPNIVILFIADMFGWDFINNRLLADHFAREIRATVYVPDFFGGEVVASHIIAEEEAWEKMDLKGGAGAGSSTGDRSCVHSGAEAAYLGNYTMVGGAV
uniref:Protein AIM2 n=1 Tax=Talaromyces marneffei PM1 TaxID=1077442 RepID=A0A093VGD9_TALMA